MEVILSTAFGVKTESQTNPDDHLMKLAKNAMARQLPILLASMIPFIGQWISKKLATTRFGDSRTKLFGVAREIIEKRKKIAAEFQRKVRFKFPALALITLEDYGLQTSRKDYIKWFMLLPFDVMVARRYMHFANYRWFHMS